MHANLRFRWQAAVLSAITLASTSLLVVGSASPAQADPPCQTGGVYVLWARGSGQSLGDVEAVKFHDHVEHALDANGIPTPNWDWWVELGNLDGSRDPGEFPDNPSVEYPAVPVADWSVVNTVNGVYAGSVTKGTDELVKHLNDRYAGDGPTGNGSCSNETLVLGGYSQGADVIGWALERNGGGGYVTLSAAAKSHIGFVALYGDPKYRGPYSTTSGCPVPMWVRANTTCIEEGVRGALQARNPYLPPEFYHRTGSWCDNGDGVCNWLLNMGGGSHTSAYRDYWIWRSAAEIATAARVKRAQLTQPTDANHDGHPDLMVVPFVGTGSNTTEVHALEGHGFGSWLYNLPSGEANKQSRNAYHLFADYNGDRVTDMYEISMNPAGSTDVHIKAGPNYTTSLGDWATPIQGQSPYTAKAALYDKNGDGKADLYMFTPRPGNKVDVHILNGTSFNQSLGDFATPAGITTMNDYEMLVGDYNHDGNGDMYLVSLKGGGAKADVHVLSGAGGFQSWLGHWTTPFGACDVNHARVMIGDRNDDGQPDLYFGVYNNGAGKMDVHVLNGHGFNSYIGNWATIAGAGSFATTDLALAS